jgi:CelD/BcsL family acetyltransferase involved in cellulose biosynthesis
MPPGALLRCVVVTDGDTVVGVAPYSVVRSGAGFYKYETAAPLMNSVEPLCAPGREHAVGHAIGGALKDADPTPDTVSLGWLAVGSALPSAVQDGWSGRRPVLIGQPPFAAPRINLPAEGIEAWLASRSRNFRKSFRNDQRKVLAAGYVHRVSTGLDEVVERLEDLRRFYEYRRATREGRGVPFDATFSAVMRDAAASSPPGRLCLATMERPGELIAADVVLRAGVESSAWFGGFEEKQAHLGASRVNIVMCIEDAIVAGDAIFDLGPGVESYKASFTEDRVMLQSHVLARRGLRPLHTPAQLLPYAARKAAARAYGRLRSAGRGG